MAKTSTGDHTDVQLVNPAAAAIDTGSTMHMAAVIPTARIPLCARLARSRAICMHWRCGSGPVA
ncbi:hypothetical protein [Marivita lacus]|uniref:hypothetical protein n=1 Tax=Marivita lacus TaxID=1323742 RepID=UPI001E5598E1|nr:hypothetical protein [Marivita lacus]